MRYLKIGRLGVVLGFTAALAACNGDDDDEETEVMSALHLDLEGLEPLAGGFHYEGWAIIAAKPVSTGKFNLDKSGNLVDLKDQPIEHFETGLDLTKASAVVLTIEPAGDTDTVPTDTHPLAGELIDGAADLAVGSPDALGDDYSSAAGNYVVATPTDGMKNNETSGLWFLDFTTGKPTVGLFLPVLPAGWIYEGWAVIDEVPVTTGTFLDGAAPDDAAPYSSTLFPAPPFPGEDYLENAPAGFTFPTDIRGGMAVISIEPSPDDGPLPFAFKPLMATIATDAADNFTYDLDNMSANLPTGTAMIE